MDLRAGRFDGQMSDDAAKFSSSIEFDKRIFDADIKVNRAHTTMLTEEGIIPKEAGEKILAALDKLEDEGIDALNLDPSFEDIHMALEDYITNLIGPEAGFMHTAKSRNDQVCTDIRLTLKDEIENTISNIKDFITTIVNMAKENLDTLFIAYTHLQHAQPNTFAHHLMAYANELRRDCERFMDTYKRVDMSPLGSAALATTGFPINRKRTAQLLGFSEVMDNSIDGVSSRDFIAESVFDYAMLSTTLGKIADEIVIWSSYEFRMVECSNAYSSTSSIMPQKKNPDIAELARGKSTIAYGELMTIMSILKGIPHSYNRDLQEITPHLWSAVDNTNDILQIVHGMLATLTINKQRTAELAGANFATATELADVMVREKNMPFRTAHNIVGRVVSDAIEQNLKATDLDDEFINKAAIEVTGKPVNLGDELVKQALDPALNVKARTVQGGPAPSAVKDAIKNMENFLS
ncbi:argininosuccinate lyase [Methanosphaera cuniculi]|uniref:Argininosuccinate lyase n=2 Tax=Methanosphaera TaxID=2316 RepID=A0A2A2HBZ1_9EURY|nr:argininosuccinate lyase [Methanosphaera cuniculi]PAV06887.1 argininosuccinate lyase [Methanosphaera cuniculi]PWL08648.1 argininosuccinate lyase 1 [Methanosphaera cuniculi]